MWLGRRNTTGRYHFLEGESPKLRVGQVGKHTPSALGLASRWESVREVS